MVSKVKGKFNREGGRISQAQGTNTKVPRPKRACRAPGKVSGEWGQAQDGSGSRDGGCSLVVGLLPSKAGKPGAAEAQEAALKDTL